MVFTFYYKITHNYAIVFRLPTAEINSMVRAFGISAASNIRSTFMPLRRKKTAVSGCFLSVVRMECSPTYPHNPHKHPTTLNKTTY